MEDPALAKGIVKREITRIITPGTVTESSMLDEGRNNYIACVVGAGSDWGVAFCDVSTGAFYATSGRGGSAVEKIINELGRFSPAEVLLGGEAAEEKAVRSTLDLNARRNLELTETLRNQEKRGSLLWVLDRTKTAMGGRMLRSWLEKPLLNPTKINRRSAAVAELAEKNMERQELQLTLREISDMERSVGRVVAGTANARDLSGMAGAMAALPQLKAQISELTAPMLQELCLDLDTLEDLCGELSRAIVDDPPFTVREGGMIRDGYHEELDRLRDIMSGGKGTLTEIENAEREKTGIPKLKVGYNRVFGYYIEISRSYQGEIPENYIRKQTLANCERYITQELKELEATILGAKDHSTALEYEIFTQIRGIVANHAPRIQASCAVVATLDVLCSLADAAVENSYVRPEVDLSDEIRITEGRHPVVEQVLKDTLFVPNDTAIGTPDCRVAVITGPTMAVKST